MINGDYFEVRVEYKPVTVWVRAKNIVQAIDNAKVMAKPFLALDEGTVTAIKIGRGEENA